MIPHQVVELRSVMVEGDTLSHYRILERIGAGAMGVVCKAQDLLLHRTVAIKYLSAQATADPASRERLLQEARAASQLDHPNICRIHEIEELQDGHIALVLSYYPGDTLSAHIARGPLTVQHAVHLQLQLLSALDHAHGKGVIHRDIKPSNMIVTPGDELKVVDFGLAKGCDDVSKLTQTGAFMGTVSYMSPEQVLCNNIDHRCDVWAAGVVLYEMLTASVPFPGPSLYAICEAVLQARPRPLRGHRADLPEALESILARALAREIADRYASAGEFRHALTSVLQNGSTVVPLTSHPGLRPLSRQEGQSSIAVLPFSCFGDHAETEYFCDGLTDEIITGLSAVRSLRTISSSSAMRLKGSDSSTQEIAQKLKVRCILKGTVWMGKSGEGSATRIRVTSQLIDPSDDSILWGGKYGGTLEDVFAIQENISREIVGALQLKLSPAEEKQIAARPLPEVHAYEYYLKAKHEILNYSREALERALELLEKGERLVGRNALLIAAKGQVYWQFVNAGISSDPDYIAKAKQCGADALELDPDSAHAQRLLGLIALQEGDMQKSARLLKQCITTDPNDSDSLSWYCAVCALSGKAYVAVPLAEHIVDIDPLTPVYRFLPGLLALMDGKFQAALPSFEEAIRLEPTNAMLLWCRGQVLAMAGRTAEAIEQLRSLQQLCPGQFFTSLGSFMAAALEGDQPAAFACATQELHELVVSDPHYSWAMAQGCSILGATDEAFVWLETAMDRGFINFPMVARWDLLLDPIRSDPRFPPLLDQMNRRWEAFEV